MAFTQEQQQNARIIISTGRKLGASDRDILIALMTASQESSLRNLSWGDRDSVGLFQQRNAWGSFSARTDPVKATRMFFLGGAVGQPGLFANKRRNSMSLSAAAQWVQRSAYPNAYAKHERGARQLFGTWAPSAQVPKSVIPTSREATTVTALPDRPSPKPLTRMELPNLADLQKPQSQAMGIDAPGASAAGIDAPDRPEGVAAPVTQTGEVPSALGIESPGMEPTSMRIPTLSRAQFGELFPDGAASLGLKTGKASTATGLRGQVVATALSNLGVKYVWGGESPDGWDCSGYLQWVFGQHGIDLPRVSFQQARVGKRVGLDKLRPGDLVAIDNSSRNAGADHIALWLGAGWIAEAPRPGLRTRKRKIGANEKGWFGVALDL